MTLAADRPIRFGASGRLPLVVPLLLFYVVVLSPIAGLVMLALSRGATSGRGVWTAATFQSFTETLQLLLSVGLLSAFIGIGTAWLVAMYRFPGRTVLAVLLVLPLAMPTYLAAYIAVEFFDYFGPAQSALRRIFGWTSRQQYAFPDIRSTSGATIVLSLVLYPYVYLPARLMFERQGGRIIQAARLHGVRGWALFTRVGVPLARPAIAGGLAFVLLETLNDIGAVEHLGVQALSLTIRAVWLNRGDIAGAAQIATLSLMLVAAILIAEHTLRRHASFASPSRQSAPASPVVLHGTPAWIAAFACALPVLAGFALPAIFLLQEALALFARGGAAPSVLTALGCSLALAVAAAVVVCLIGVLVALAARLSRSSLARMAPRIGSLGYAIPGTVLVIALFPVYAMIDATMEWAGARLFLSGSLGAIVIAYVLRFAGLGISQAETGLARLSGNIDHAARTLGASPQRIAFAVLAPNIVRAIGLAGLLVLVDAMKELPATLLLRPLNVETLATSLYGHASSGQFENGALEALLLLVVGLIPAIVLARLR